jgi:hypothetical protein
MNIKSIWTSKTFYFNAISLVIVIVQYLANQNWLKPEIVVGILGIGNLILRTFFTNTALSLSKPIETDIK